MSWPSQQPELSPRELATAFVDQQQYFVSEATVYRLLKAHDLIERYHRSLKNQILLENEVSGASVKLSAVALKKTGRSRSIDGYSYEEYRGIERMDVMDVTVDQCMSQMPMARESSQTFRRRWPRD